MNDRNTALHAGFAYWKDTPGMHDPTWIGTDSLLESFNECMDQTGLSERIGKDSFERILESYGYEKKSENGETLWKGVVSVLPPLIGYPLVFGFPKILG